MGSPIFYGAASLGNLVPDISRRRSVLMAPYPRRTETLTTLLRKPKNSQAQGYFRLVNLFNGLV